MSIEISQSRQRAEDLHFSLYQRALHPELFHIHQVRRVEQRAYSAEIWVVGLAHVVTVQFGDQYLTELVAEHSDLLPRMGLANTFRFRGERDYSQSFTGGLRYILSTQVERMTSNLFPATHRDIASDRERKGMYWEAEDYGPDGLKAFSFLDFEARDSEFHVHAFHLFPGERTVVRTQSIFETERRRSGQRE